MMDYSDRAKIGYAKLYQPYNDMDIYVEDGTCRNLYEILFNRMLAGRGRISRVIPLSGREQVLGAWRADKPAEKRPRLYIIDGDFDRLTGKRVAADRRLYRLTVYSVENLIIDERAIIEVSRESLTEADQLEIERRFGFQQIKDVVNGPLMSLWILYAVAAKLRCGSQTVGYQVFRLAEDPQNLNTLSARRIRARMRELISEIWGERGKRRYMGEKAKVLARVKRHRVAGMQVVSGKDYIFPLVYQKCQRVANLRDTARALKVRLARHCDLDVDRGLKRALRRTLKQHSG